MTGEPFEYHFEDEHGNVRVVEVSAGDHARRGECSGIPRCCVEAYLLGDSVGDTGWGYMPCAGCVESGNRVEVRDCAADDGARCTCGAWTKSRVCVEEPGCPITPEQVREALEAGAKERAAAERIVRGRRIARRR